MASHLDINVTTEDDNKLAVLDCKGSLDTYTFEKLDIALDQLFTCGCNRFLVDLTQVEHISSAGAGILASACKSADEKGGRFSVVAVSPRLLEVFGMLGIATMLNICADRNSSYKILRAG